MRIRLHAVIGLLLVAALAGCATAPAPRSEAPAPAPSPTAPPAPPASAQLPAAESAVPEAITPAVALDLWGRIRAGFRLNPLDSPLVADHEEWYAARPDYVQRMTERSQRYLFFIVEEVQKRGMPTEVALLPMIESAFNPKALSTSNASGIWQFIPSTGKHYGLDQNWWYDGRRDVMAATDAALDYLQKLYDQFGAWELALAAYNCGEGCVARAIAASQARGLPGDYLSLNLPSETRNYVPKLMAVKNIVLAPAEHGLALNAIPNRPYFETVEIRKHIDVALAARFADLSLEEFSALNPAYNRPVISPRDSTRLLLPAENAEMFRANLRRFSDRPLHSWQAYPAQKGERVEAIAGRFGMTAAELRSLNTVREKKKRLLAAQLLLVPVKLGKPLPQPVVTRVAAAPRASETLPAPEPAPSAKSPPLASALAKAPESAAPASHTVQQGDTLFSIARAHGTTVDALQHLNQLESTTVKTGETLQLPVDAPVVAAAPAPAMAGTSEPAGIEPTNLAGSVSAAPVALALEDRPMAAPGPTPTPQPAATRVAYGRGAPPIKARHATYIVRPGDTLFKIARAFQVAVADLARWNRLALHAPLHAGTRVRIAQVR